MASILGIPSPPPLPITKAPTEAGLAWTPRLFEAFRRKAGYDLEPYLPALVYDIGPKTEKVRCDYLDVISDLYSNSFFKQVDGLVPGAQARTLRPCLGGISVLRPLGAGRLLPHPAVP